MFVNLVSTKFTIDCTFNIFRDWYKNCKLRFKESVYLLARKWLNSFQIIFKLQLQDSAGCYESVSSVLTNIQMGAHMRHNTFGAHELLPIRNKL